MVHSDSKEVVGFDLEWPPTNGWLCLRVVSFELVVVLGGITNMVGIGL